MDAQKRTITRRLDSVLNGLQDEFQSWYEKEDFESKLNALERAGTKSSRPSKLKELYRMFDGCGIPYEKGRDNAYYREIVEQADISSNIEDRMLYALYTRYSEYPSPEDYMQRMVERLSAEEDSWSEDSLRLRILKQFIKYGNYLADAGFGGKKAVNDYVKMKTGAKPSAEDILRLVDDGVFADLEGATKAQRKPDGKYGLLKTADDLATGKFRAEGATKRSLYLFAMVYGMTYDSGAAENNGKTGLETDIETNLFRDYYTNNFMRFISEAYKDRLCEYEMDPSGQGINYKNFAEVIYLYYIAADYSPQEKIRRSTEMIERVRKKQYKKGKPNLSDIKEKTVFYRKFIQKGNANGLFIEDILNLPETEFEEFIAANYNCDTFAGAYQTKAGEMERKVSVFQLETNQDTAYSGYLSILRELSDLGVSLENCNYGLWFTDAAAFRKKGYENICSRKAGIDHDKFEEFMELLLGVNRFMGSVLEEKVNSQSGKQEWSECSKMKTKALFVPSAYAITRTSMIVAYYYYYNAWHEDEGREERISFEEFFLDFKQEIDEKLAAACYQTLSGKNILDVLVVFSSYFYLYG